MPEYEALLAHLKLRHWVDERIETLGRADGDFALGYVAALEAVKAHWLLSPVETQEVHRAGKEMGF